MLAGGCLCRAIRYQAAGEPFSRAVCHCTTCQKAHAAPMVAFFSVRRADLVLSGEPSRFRSSAHGERLFCGACGMQLLFEDARYPDEIDVSTSTLDDPALAAPQFHIWTRSQQPWLKLADGLPAYPERRQPPPTS